MVIGVVLKTRLFCLDETAYRQHMLRDSSFTLKMRPKIENITNHISKEMRKEVKGEKKEMKEEGKRRTITG